MDQRIKEQLVLLKSAKEHKDKLSIASKLLLTTNILTEENALACFDFDKDDWYNEKNYFKKFLEYKKNTGVYSDADCDVSLLCVVMYTLLNDNLHIKDITNQSNSNNKFVIRLNDNIYKGDTLTSALKSIKLYLCCLWKDINSNEKLKNEKKNSEFYKLFNSIKYGVPHLVESTECWDEYCYRNSEIIWRAMDAPVKEFLKSVFKFGNYMCIPGKSYQVTKKWTSFNVARSCAGRWDTIDTLLWKMHLYYMKKDEKYLSYIFTEKREEIKEETLLFLDKMGMKSWEQFVRKNCLEDFVYEQSMAPLSMKTGKEISLDESANYNAMPQSRCEFLQYFNQLSKRINLRSERLSKKLRCKRGIYYEYH